MLVINTIAKYESDTKMFSCWNFKMIILSFLLTYPGIWGVNYIDDIILSKKEFLAPENAATSIQNVASPLYQLERIISESKKIVCSETCHCPLNPEYYKGMKGIEVVDARSYKKCSGKPNVQCLYYDIKKEGYNVQKCLEDKAIARTFYDEDEDFDQSLLKVMGKIETNNHCSGGLDKPDK